jgi:hypothetical protein
MTMSIPTASAVRSPAGSPAVVGPLPEHLAQIRAARLALTPIRRAATWAAFDGWTVLVFGVLSILCSFGFNMGMGLGIVMTVFGWRDVSAAKALRRLDRTALPHLVLSQIVLGVALTIYFGWCLYGAISGPSLLTTDPEITREMNGAMPGLDNMVRSMTAAGYAALLAFSIIVPAFQAYYYRGRQSKLDAYLASAPRWIVDLQRSGVGVGGFDVVS